MESKSCPELRWKLALHVIFNMLSLHGTYSTFLTFQFAEKFQEVKESAKLARDKSQEKAETLSNHSEVNTMSAIQLQDAFSVPHIVN